eukprot:12027693-Karenia_brevis.AAC.1
MAGVHRVLASGHRVCQNQDAILYGNRGYLIPHSNIISRKMREHLDFLVKKYGDGDITTMRVDKGVY